MSRKDPPRAASLVLPALLVALGLGLRLWNATRPIDTLLRTTLPDDAFYYFGIARHLSIGDPPSIDGVNPTNGYHPLWMALLVPIYRLANASDLISPIRVAVVLGALLDTVSSVFVYRICRRVGLGAVASSAALFVFVANPRQVINATCGLETALALCTGLALVCIQLPANIVSREQSSPAEGGGGSGSRSEAAGGQGPPPNPIPRGHESSSRRERSSPAEGGGGSGSRSEAAGGQGPPQTQTRDDNGGATPRAPHPAWFGFVAGLAVLARTDQIILATCLFGVSAWRVFRADGVVAAARWKLSALGAGLVTFAPWAAYSFHTVGTVVQSSALAMSFVHRHMPEVWGIPSPSFALQAARAMASVTEANAIVWKWQGVPGSVAAVFVVLFVASLAASGPEQRAVFLGKLRGLAPLFGATALLFVAHTLVRWVFREWYTAPFIAVGALSVGLAVSQLVSWSHRPKEVALLTAALLALWTWHGAAAFGAPIYYQQRAGAPNPMTHEGHSDCGVESYFSERGITNLDGIVNEHALDALTHGRLLAYLRGQHFKRVFMTDYFQSDVFFGPRYREEIVTVDSMPRAFRVVKSPLEKDARIGPTDEEVPLGEPTGREYLSDGWMWNATSRPAVASIGVASELVVYLPRVADDVRLELRAAALVVDARGVQPVTVYVNDRVVASLEVTAAFAVFTVPLRTAVVGRNRIRLVYGAPRARRSKELDWWRTRDGNPIVAIEASTLWIRGVTKQTFTLPLVGEGSIRCKGCYGVEGSGKNRFRWTNGDATLTFPRLPVDDAAECRLTVSLTARGHYQLFFNGAPLAGANGSFLIPKAAFLGDENGVFEVRSATFSPSSKGHGEDTRTLGVALEKFELACW